MRSGGIVGGILGLLLIFFFVRNLRKSGYCGGSNDLSFDDAVWDPANSPFTAPSSIARYDEKVEKIATMESKAGSTRGRTLSNATAFSAGGTGYKKRWSTVGGEAYRNYGNGSEMQGGPINSAGERGSVDNRLSSYSIYSTSSDGPHQGYDTRTTTYPTTQNYSAYSNEGHESIHPSISGHSIDHSSNIHSECQATTGSSSSSMTHTYFGNGNHNYIPVPPVPATMAMGRRERSDVMSVIEAPSFGALRVTNITEEED